MFDIQEKTVGAISYNDLGAYPQPVRGSITANDMMNIGNGSELQFTNNAQPSNSSQQMASPVQQNTVPVQQSIPEPQMNPVQQNVVPEPQATVPIQQSIPEPQLNPVQQTSVPNQQNMMQGQQMTNPAESQPSNGVWSTGGMMQNAQSSLNNLSGSMNNMADSGTNSLNQSINDISNQINNSIQGLFSGNFSLGNVLNSNESGFGGNNNQNNQGVVQSSPAPFGQQNVMQAQQQQPIVQQSQFGQQVTGDQQPVQSVQQEVQQTQPVQQQAQQEAQQTSNSQLLAKNIPSDVVLLNKGQKTPINANSLEIRMGWNIKNPSCDLDVSAFMLDNNNKVIGDDWFVFYGQKNSPDNSTHHLDADNSDSGIVTVDLNSVDTRVSKIVFVVTINEALENNLNFSMIDNTYIRLVNAQDNNELFRFNLSDYYENVTSMMVGEIYKHNDQWKFNPIGDGVAKDLGGLCEMYEVNVA